MRFSVIVPVYNVENYLLKCAASLQAQTFQDFEVVMVDDGSTDGSYSVMKRIHEQDKDRFRMVRQENRGLGGARNTGVRMAKGEYLFFLDSDDYILPETLEIADEYLRRYGDDLLMTLWREVGPGDVEPNEVDRRLISYETLTPEQYICGYGGPQSFFVRADVFGKNDLQWPERLWYEDHTLLPLFALHCGSIGRINARLYQYVRRETSIMHSTDTSRMMEIIDGSEFYLDRYRSEGKLDQYYEELEFRTVIAVLFLHIPRLFAVGREMEKAQASWQYVKNRFPTFQTNPRIVQRVRRYRPEQLMLEGRLEELWEEYYAPCQERARRWIAAHPDGRVCSYRPMLSVIVPVYNVEAYLVPCLASVLCAVEGIDSEVILVNDGSTDESGSIARLFAAEYSFIRLTEQENRGLSAARNVGMDLARGKYIAFVDSDDEVYPDMYRDMLRMAETGNADMVVCPASSGFDAPSPWGKPELHARAFSSLKPGSVSREDRYVLLGSDPYAWDKLYRREFVRAAGVRYPEGKTFEDNGPSAMLYSKADRIYAVQRPGYFYRARKGGAPSIVQGQQDQRMPELLEMMEYTLRMVEEQTQDEAVLLALKDRYLGHDIDRMLTARKMSQFDHLPAFLDRLRAMLGRCFQPEDVSRQRAIVRAKVRALMEGDVDALVRIDTYDRQIYKKEPVTLENGTLVQHLDEQLLGVDSEPAVGLPFDLLPGVYADRYEKRDGLCRLGARLTISGLPRKTELGAVITVSLVGTITGRIWPLEAEPGEGLDFTVTLEEDKLWSAVRSREKILLRVEASSPVGSFAAYATCPTGERLFRNETEELWLRRLSDGRICFETAPRTPEPLVSVILPVYNARETLPRAMRSLLSQTHENLEILLIDDGSTDGSGELCDTYAAGQTRVKAFHLDHGGVARARNFALEHFAGDYLMFVDADDLVSPDITARLLEVLRQSGQHIAACIAKDTRDPTLETHSCAIRLGVDHWRWSRINYQSDLSRRVIWGAIYDRTAIEGLRFDESYVASTDTLFFAQAAKKLRRYAQVNEPHYCYVYYPDSVCHSNSDRRKLDDILVWDRVQRMNPEGSRGFVSAGKGLYSKMRRLMDESHDAAVHREVCRVARQHRKDDLREKNRRKRLARKLFLTMPAEYELALKGKRLLNRWREKDR